MAATGRTQVNGPEQEQSGTVTRALLNTLTAGSAVIAKLILGVGLVMSQTGADAGTGDVTLSVMGNRPCGRLTLASGTPVMTTTVSAAATVYYTPYTTNGFPQWNGTVFLDGLFAETSQALSDATKSPAAGVASMGYDVFGWYDSSTTPATFRATRGPAWTAGATAGTWTAGGGSCARGAGAGSTALTLVQGLLVNQYAITNGPAAGYGVYLGTIGTDSSGATVTWNLGSSAAGGGKATLNVYNYFNRVKFCPTVKDSTASHTYSASSYRAFDNSATNSITIVRGVTEDQVVAQFSTRVTAAAANAATFISMGVDASTGYSNLANVGYASSGTSGSNVQITCVLSGDVGVGIHTIYAVEQGDGTNANTIYGYPYAALTSQTLQ